MTTLALACANSNLRRAWQELWSGRTRAARSHGAGVDGVTLADWAGHGEARLAALRTDLLTGRYRPAPLRWFDIPHREPGRTRRLGIPTVTDRVAQRAVKRVLEPVCETLFLPCSHGFRPGRSVLTAIAHVLRYEAQGLPWVADADIAACFDALDHGLLLSRLAALIPDDRLLGLVAGWLVVGESAPGQGIAQGAVLSPLLANLYLHTFDVAMVRAGLALVRYADDWVIMCRSPQVATQALERAAAALADLGLALNPAKTGVVPLGSGFQFLGARFE